MRTTVDLDDSLLLAAKAIARDEGISLGLVLSRLARRGLASGTTTITRAEKSFPVFVTTTPAQPITLDTVNEHRDDA
jgi:hypothetical protein